MIIGTFARVAHAVCVEYTQRPMTSASERRRIERRQKITAIILTVLALAAVVGLVIWVTSHFGRI